MALPACTGPYGVMPVGIYPATLSDIRGAFVDSAPASQRSQRSLVFRALEVHLELMRGILPDATVWLDGGFVSHKHWAAPADADLAFLISGDQLAQVTHEAAMHLLTTSGVTGAIGGDPDGSRTGVPRLQPMGGLVDAFIALDAPGSREYWQSIWSAVTGPDGARVVGLAKGFVEVVW